MVRRPELPRPYFASGCGSLKNPEEPHGHGLIRLGPRRQAGLGFFPGPRAPEAIGARVRRDRRTVGTVGEGDDHVGRHAWAPRGRFDVDGPAVDGRERKARDRAEPVAEGPHDRRRVSACVVRWNQETQQDDETRHDLVSGHLRDGPNQVALRSAEHRHRDSTASVRRRSALRATLHARADSATRLEPFRRGRVRLKKNTQEALAAEAAPFHGRERHVKQLGDSLMGNTLQEMESNDLRVVRRDTGERYEQLLIPRSLLARLDGQLHVDLVDRLVEGKVAAMPPLVGAEKTQRTKSGDRRQPPSEPRAIANPRQKTQCQDQRVLNGVLGSIRLEDQPGRVKGSRAMTPDERVERIRVARDGAADENFIGGIGRTLELRPGWSRGRRRRCGSTLVGHNQRATARNRGGVHVASITPGDVSPAGRMRPQEMRTERNRLAWNCFLESHNRLRPIDSSVTLDVRRRRDSERGLGPLAQA